MTRCGSRALLAMVLLGALSLPTAMRAAVRLLPVQTLVDGTGLHGAGALVITPDRRHVYAAGQSDSALVAFARDGQSGSLTRIQVLRDDIAGADGLRRVSSIAGSPDGAHLYVLGGGDNALSVWARDATTGLLDLVEVERDETGPIHGLDTLGSVVVSPDGRHVYVTGGFDVVTVFSRDPVSGALSFVEEQRGTDGIDGLQGTDAIAVSPDGRHVYVGGFNEDALVVFTRDAQSGGLTPSGLLRDGVGGVDGLDQIRGISISPDGHSVYVAAYDDDSIAVFDRNADSGLLSFVEVQRNDSGAVRDLDGAYSVAVDPDGRRVFATGLDSASMVVFERDPATGRLGFVTAFVDGEAGVDGLNGAVRLALSPDGATVYVAGAFDDAIAIFRDGEPPLFVAAERNRAGSIDGLAGAQVATLSADGERLYVAGGDDGKLAVFARNADTGQLEFIEVYEREGFPFFPRPSLIATPDGTDLITAEVEQGVSVRRHDSVSGVLSVIQRIDMRAQNTDPAISDAVYLASALAITPDGTQVFVTSSGRSTLSVFDRDAASGELRYRTTVLNDEDAEPTGIAVSADGMFVYTIAARNGTVVAFRRAPPDGDLQLVQVVREGDAGVVGLRLATALALSPDGSALYVVSGGITHHFGADALVVFERDRETGRLSFVQALDDGVAGVDGLAGASSLAVLPDGSAVIVAGPTDNALAVFTRNRQSGRLNFEHAIRNGGGIDGLAGAASVTVSGDGGYLYVLGSADHALKVFRLISDADVTCPGDCDADGIVSIDHLIVCVNTALGRANLAECLACDADASGSVGIDDLIRAVSSALEGCPGR